MSRRRTPRGSRVPRHRFVPDWSMPAESPVPAHRRAAGLGARRFCAGCGLPGEPGDVRHPAPDPELMAAAAELDRRRVGEREEGGVTGGG